MEEKLFHKKKIDKKICFFQTKLLFITIIGIAMVLLPTVSSVDATPDTTTTPDISQEISQIANQLVTANPGIDSNKVSQTLEQLASQTAATGEGSGDVNQIITQIADQVATNPKGPVAQNILQQAQQEAVSTLQLSLIHI